MSGQEEAWRRNDFRGHKFMGTRFAARSPNECDAGVNATQGRGMRTREDTEEALAIW